jgi:hypothetical protein
MPDITMCQNRKCPARSICYRFRAVPDEHWQSFATFEPDHFSGGCEMYIPIFDQRVRTMAEIEAEAEQ